MTFLARIGLACACVFLSASQVGAGIENSDFASSIAGFLLISCAGFFGFLLLLYLLGLLILWHRRNLRRLSGKG